MRDDPKNPTALYLPGRALTIRGSYDEAESVLKKSANVSPNSFVLYVLLSSLYLRREEYNDAEKYLLNPPARPGMKNGYVITMLATSLSPVVENVDDVGVKDELATILESFQPNQNF